MTKGGRRKTYQVRRSGWASVLKTILSKHWLNFRVLRWEKWSYTGVLLIGNMSVTGLVLVAREGS